jgi:predicted ArsR family transcriptional regulator
LQAERQRQARALGDPTRHAVFRFIDEADAPVTVAQLTDHLGLNHNAIRQHLAKLCQAGLVVESLAPATGPGRRRLQYRVDPNAVAAWGGESPYEQLALLLLELRNSGRSARDVGYDAGRAFATRPRLSSSDPVDALMTLVARQGFEPRRVERDGETEIVLDRCPYAAAASADPATVCELHRGLAEGMADAVREVEVTDLVAHNPTRAGCRVRLSTEGAVHDV